MRLASIAQVTRVWYFYVGMARTRISIDWRNLLGPLASADGGLSQAELCDLGQAVQVYSPRSIRLRPGTCDQDLPFCTEPVAWFARGRRLTESHVRPGAFLQFAAGDYYIQDAASFLPIALAMIQPGHNVCDLCAAPGGKSTALAEELLGQGVLVANEVIRSRLSMLELALARSGYGNHLILNLEPEQLAALCRDRFDRVIVDAPCTGQSMVAKGKQTLSAFSPRQIDHSAARQRRILRSAARLVVPGGRLVYSTCTFSHAENEGVFSWLSDNLPGWRPVVEPQLTPWAGQVAGTYRLWPHRDPCAGGFAAALDRPSSEGYFSDSRRRDEPNALEGSHGRPNFRAAMFYEIDPATFTGELIPGQWMVRGDGSLHRFASGIETAWMEAAHAGVEIAIPRTGVWTPSYPSATLSSAILTVANSIDLSDAEAARFMAGESLRCSGQSNGWSRVCWRSRSLAWGKYSASVLKNHLPKQLRLPSSLIC